MKFEGEHLLPGQIGHFFVLLAFIASLVSTIAYFKTNREQNVTEKKAWLRYARFAFATQVFSIFVVFGIIYYICANHYFEYLYAYKHASKELEPKYLLACIWEGQEGSFLLWSIWHSVLGCILIFRSKEWEAPAMSVISVAQFFLMLMILGLYFFDVRIGSSPFVLTRNEIEAPIFARADYLMLIKDGVGLNVLLRNYWMVIHPPVLFLGFASTLVPVAFAYAGLITKKWKEWIIAALPWTLFSAVALGVGIMMGGKWAYESLSFGGYWAWDPVENASLVPWLILIAGLHCMLVYNKTGNSLKASFFFIILTNAFVLYSTFLTRTGILGDSSVHSFTEAGMAMNILIGMFALAVPLPMIILFFKNVKDFPAPVKEENLSSREFWMFIGSLVLFLAAMFIIAVTSVPVYNKLFNTHIADPEDREFTYNKVMVLVAVVIGVLTAASQYFKFKQTDKKYFLRKIWISVVAALVLTFLLAFIYPIVYTKQGYGFLGAIYLALFSCLFAIIANLNYLFSVLKGNYKVAGASLSHTGFAVMILGMLISSGNKETISDNRKTGLYMAFDKDPSGKGSESPLENLTLLKNVPTEMGAYTITYVSDSGSSEKNRAFYKLLAERKNAKGEVTEKFELDPDVYKMKDNNLSSNPDIKHYFTHDVFTYISSLPDKSNRKDTVQFKVHEMKLNDTVFLNKGYLILNSVSKNPSNSKHNFSDSDTALVADLTFYSNDSTSTRSFPYLYLNKGDILLKDDTLATRNLYTRFAGLTNDQKFKIATKETEIPMDFLTLKAYVFPYINLVWTGLIIMAAGIVLSIIKRIKAPTVPAMITLLTMCGLLFYMFFLAN
ncbi:cytochrome c biogenesis protein CcsA [soil metagenome]